MKELMEGTKDEREFMRDLIGAWDTEYVIGGNDPVPPVLNGYTLTR